MAKINWIRLVSCSLIATAILFFTDGYIHERILSADWQAVYEGLRTTEPAPHRTNILYFVLFELGRGFTAMMLYVTMRARCGAGPKTAVLAAIVTWFAFSVAGPAQFIPLGFYSNALWVKVAALQFISTSIATVAGAWVYKDPVITQTAAV